MANLIEYECNYCHKITLDFPSQKRNYCSVNCYFAAKKAGIVKIKSSKIKHICEYCGKVFYRFPCRQGRFCSRACAGIVGSKEPRPNRKLEYPIVTRYCGICGKEFKRKGSEILRPGYGSYCSNECRHYANSLSKRGSNNPNWTGGIKPNSRGENWGSQSRKAKERDGHECQICHRRRENNGRKWIIDVHHIIPYRYFNNDFKNANELNNLITVCRKCHRKLEKESNNVSPISIQSPS
jgi:5-methylcytosine-specific restriction endonuclease McrA